MGDPETGPTKAQPGSDPADAKDKQKPIPTQKTDAGTGCQST